jgi:hypothetical protein
MKRTEVLLVMGMVAICGACASRTPHVRQVEGSQYKEDVGKADRYLFASDRASHLRVNPKPLPPALQREEYYVTWSGVGVGQVKFEYRQVNIPDKTLVQTASPTNQHWCTFTVAGDDFIKGGPISAWRVSLWDGDRSLAEQKSVLW